MPTVPLTFTIPSADGNAYPTVVDDTTRQLYYALSATADGSWHFRGQVPDDYGSSPSLIVVCIANATTGVHRIGVDVAAVKDGEDQDPTLTALTVQGVTVPGTAYQQHRITFSSGIPTLEPGDRIIGRVWRDGDGSGGTDSLAVPTLLDTVLLSYTAA
jgi:hypothetical protein